MMTSSRDTLNPLLNTETLMGRLTAIEYYKYRHGVMYARWPHFVLKKMGNTLWRYKVNYAVKGFAAYLVYSEYRQFKHMDEMAILTLEQDASFVLRVTGKALACGALCCII